MLGYLFVRMLVAGFARASAPGRSCRWCRSGGSRSAASLLAAGRIALNVVDSHVIDIGVAGVIGADRIAARPAPLPGRLLARARSAGDVYGPFNYLAYLPFEEAFPWDGDWESTSRRRTRRRSASTS